MAKRLVNTEIVLASRPKGWITEANFAVRESEFELTPPTPGSKDVILKTMWVSLDPYLRELMNETAGALPIPIFQLNKPINAFTLSRVIASDNPEFQEGDVVCGYTDVANYVVIAGGRWLEKVDPNVGVPLTHYLGVLGLPGHSAWVGINLIAQLKPKEEVFISSAAGAVGLVAGQLAKLKGCRVVGSAGSDEKVEIIKEVYKFDDGFNYKVETDWDTAFKRHFSKGFDVYFDNVGGHMLEAVLDNINSKGRIVACGMVSQYNKEPSEKDGVPNLFNFVGKSLKMEGFVLYDYRHTKKEFLEEMIPLLQQGLIHYREHVLGRSIHEFPKAMIGMLKGENIGKSMLLVNND